MGLGAWGMGMGLGVGLSSADQCSIADTARQYCLGSAPDSPTRSPHQVQRTARTCAPVRTTRGAAALPRARRHARRAPRHARAPAAAHARSSAALSRTRTEAATRPALGRLGACTGSIGNGVTCHAGFSRNSAVSRRSASPDSHGRHRSYASFLASERVGLSHPEPPPRKRSRHRLAGDDREAHWHVVQMSVGDAIGLVVRIGLRLDQPGGRARACHVHLIRAGGRHLVA